MDLKSLKKTFDSNKTKVFQMMSQPEFSTIEDLIESCLKSIEESKCSKYDYDSLQEIVTLYSLILRVSQERNPLNYFKSIDSLLSVRSRTREKSLHLKFSDSLRFILTRIHILSSKIWKKVIIVSQKQIKVFSSATLLNSVYKTDALIENLQKSQEFSLDLTNFNIKTQEIIDNLHKFQVEVEQNSEFCSITLTDTEIHDQVQQNIENFIKWTKMQHIEKIIQVENLKAKVNFNEFLKKLTKTQSSAAADMLIKEQFLVKVEKSLDVNWHSKFCKKVKDDLMVFDKFDLVYLSSYFSEICLKFGIIFNENIVGLLESIRVPQNWVRLFDHVYEILFGELNSKNIRQKCVIVTDFIHMHLNTCKGKVLSRLDLYSFSFYVNSCRFIHFNILHLKLLLKKYFTEPDLHFLMFYKLNSVLKQSISEIFNIILIEFKSKLECQLNSTCSSQVVKEYQLKLIINEFRNSFDVIHNYMHSECSKIYIGKLFDLLLMTTEKDSTNFDLDIKIFASKLKEMLSKYLAGDFKIFCKYSQILMIPEESSKIKIE